MFERLKTIEKRYEELLADPAVYLRGGGDPYPGWEMPLLRTSDSGRVGVNS